MLHPKPYKPSGRDIYYFSYYENGKRKKVSTRCKLKREAILFIENYFDKLRPIGMETTFAEYAQAYYKWGECPRCTRLKTEGKTIGQAHAAQCRYYLETYILADPVFPYIPMSDIRRRDLLDMRERLIVKLNKKSNTINKIMATLKSIISEAHLREDISSNPGLGVSQIHYAQEEISTLTLDEIKAIFKDRPGAFHDPVCWDFFFVLFNTGMRSGELRALKWDMWDSDRKVISIHRAWKAQKTIRENKVAEQLGHPKWDRLRDIPVSDRIAEIIDRQVTWGNGQFIFGYPKAFRGKYHLGATWVYKNFTQALGLMGLQDNRKLSPHGLRHAMNTYALSKGVSPVLTSAYLGWSRNSQLTRVQQGYTHLTPEHLLPVVQALEELWTL